MFVVLFQCISKLKDLTCGFTPPYVALLLALLLTLFFAAVTPMQCNYLFFILHFFYIFSHVISIMLHDMDPERFACLSQVKLKQLNSTLFQVHPHQDHHTQPRCYWPS